MGMTDNIGIIFLKKKIPYRKKKNPSLSSIVVLQQPGISFQMCFCVSQYTFMSVKYFILILCPKKFKFTVRIGSAGI